MRCRTLLTLWALPVRPCQPPCAVDAQRAGTFMGSAEDPAIRYSTAPLNNAVVDVNRKLQDGGVQFTFDSRSGFLPIGARGAADSGRFAAARLLAPQPAGKADRRTESARAVLQRPRRARLGARRRRARGGRARRVCRRRVLHPRPACRARPARRSSSGPSSAWGVT